MLKISSANQLLFYKENEIVRFEAKTKTTIIHFLDGKTLEIYEPIESIDKQIKSHDFILIHQNHLVNIHHITGIPHQKPEFIEINKTNLLPISPEQYDIIIELISAHLKP